VLDPTPFILVAGGVMAGGLGAMWLGSRWRRAWRGRWGARPPALREDRVVTQVIAERMQAVGKLVALEVHAKEIATATSGWAWLPPLLLSQARLAMIFNFEKQYYVDLTRVREEDVEVLAEDDGAPLGDRWHGGAPVADRRRLGRFRVTLPEIEGSLRLCDVTPYDIQNARVLGLLDVIPMTADRQRDLMKRAQAQAAELYGACDERYLRQARLSAERHLAALMEMFGVEVVVAWRPARPAKPPAGPIPKGRLEAAA
jgi:hypothetical protein